MIERPPGEMQYFPEGEHPPEDVGIRTIPFRLREAQGDPEEVLSNREELDKHEALRKAVNSFHDAGKEVWGYWNAHKGIVLTAVAGAAATAGTVGIGILIKRREKKKSD